MTQVTLARMVGPKRPGPAPLPVAEKMTAIALVKGTPSQRAELEAWAARERAPLAALLRSAGLAAARLHIPSTQAPSTIKRRSSSKVREPRNK